MPDWKFLDWRNRQDSSFEQPDLPGDNCELSPAVFPDNDTPVSIVFTASLAEITQMLSALEKGAQLSYPDTWHTPYWNFVKQWECAELPMNCEQLLECLQPLFDELLSEIENLDEQLEQVRGAQEASRMTAPEPVTASDTSARCGGAAYVVDSMDLVNEKAFLDWESSGLDNLIEAIPIIIEAIPFIGELPFDEMLDIVNMYFENQFTDYQTDFIAARDDLIGSLSCFIEANSNTFDYTVWGDWLVFVGQTMTGNRATELFSRYAPANQNFLNQLLTVLFNNTPLREYFNTLYAAFLAGTSDPITCPDYDCATEVAFAVGLFDACGLGAYETVPFQPGEAFDITATEIGSSGAFYLAVVLPDGNWQVTVNSVTGTITPPVDTSQTAYAWFEPGVGLQTVPWNTPASPDDFGTQDCEAGFFAPWCASQGFYFVLFNEAAFSANVTVTAL